MNWGILLLSSIFQRGQHAMNTFELRRRSASWAWWSALRFSCLPIWKIMEELKADGRKVEVQEWKTRGFSFFRFILPGELAAYLTLKENVIRLLLTAVSLIPNTQLAPFHTFGVLAIAGKCNKIKLTSTSYRVLVNLMIPRKLNIIILSLPYPTTKRGTHCRTKAYKMNAPGFYPSGVLGDHNTDQNRAKKKQSNLVVDCRAGSQTRHHVYSTSQPNLHAPAFTSALLWPFPLELAAIPCSTVSFSVPSLTPIKHLQVTHIQIVHIQELASKANKQIRLSIRQQH
jgi:hypothetical protein